MCPLFVLYFSGYVLALDLTARNLQAAAKKAGNPWAVSKGYDTFCPVSKFIPKEQIKDPQNLRSEPWQLSFEQHQATFIQMPLNVIPPIYHSLWCKVNSEMRQDGNTKDMIFTIPQLISVCVYKSCSYLSPYLELLLSFNFYCSILAGFSR